MSSTAPVEIPEPPEGLDEATFAQGWLIDSLLFEICRQIALASLCGGLEDGVPLGLPLPALPH